MLPTWQWHAGVARRRVPVTGAGTPLFALQFSSYGCGLKQGCARRCAPLMPVCMTYSLQLLNGGEQIAQWWAPLSCSQMATSCCSGPCAIQHARQVERRIQRPRGCAARRIARLWPSALRPRVDDALAAPFCRHALLAALARRGARLAASAAALGAAAGKAAHARHRAAAGALHAARALHRRRMKQQQQHGQTSSCGSLSCSRTCRPSLHLLPPALACAGRLALM